MEFLPICQMFLCSPRLSVVLKGPEVTLIRASLVQQILVFSPYQYFLYIFFYCHSFFLLTIMKYTGGIQKTSYSSNKCVFSGNEMECY